MPSINPKKKATSSRMVIIFKFNTMECIKFSLSESKPVYGPFDKLSAPNQKRPAQNWQTQQEIRGLIEDKI